MLFFCYYCWYCWVKMPFNLSWKCVCENISIFGIFILCQFPKLKHKHHWMHSFERETQYCQHLVFVEIGNLLCCALTGGATVTASAAAATTLIFAQFFLSELRFSISTLRCELNHFNLNTFILSKLTSHRQSQHIQACIRIHKKQCNLIHIICFIYNRD